MMFECKYAGLQLRSARGERQKATSSWLCSTQRPPVQHNMIFFFVFWGGPFILQQAGFQEVSKSSTMCRKWDMESERALRGRNFALTDSLFFWLRSEGDMSLMIRSVCNILPAANLHNRAAEENNKKWITAIRRVSPWVTVASPVLKKTPRFFLRDFTGETATRWWYPASAVA